MSKFLQKSELTERRSFIKALVMEMEFLPDNAVVRYSVHMPDNSLVPGEKRTEDTAERLSGILCKRDPTTNPQESRSLVLIVRAQAENDAHRGP